MIRISSWKTNRDAQKFVETLDARFREVGRNLAYQSAVFVFEEIYRKLPAGKYKESLELVQVEEGVFAVRATNKAQRVSEVSSESTVLYVRPKSKRTLRLSPEIGVLARYSPWTMQTLPFFPSRRKATVISRKVRRGELERVNEDRGKDRRLWKAELEDLGIRPQAKLDISPKARVLPDVAFEALRIEFGLGGREVRPHWRPALRALASNGIARMLSRRSPAMQPVTAFRYSKSLVLTDGSIPVSEAKKFEEFQKRLKVKIR